MDTYDIYAALNEVPKIWFYADNDNYYAVLALLKENAEAYFKLRFDNFDIKNMSDKIPNLYVSGRVDKFHPMNDSFKIIPTY